MSRHLRRRRRINDKCAVGVGLEVSDGDGGVFVSFDDAHDDIRYEGMREGVREREREGGREREVIKGEGRERERSGQLTFTFREGHEQHLLRRHHRTQTNRQRLRRDRFKAKERPLLRLPHPFVQADKLSGCVGRGGGACETDVRGFVDAEKKDIDGVGLG